MNAPEALQLLINHMDRMWIHSDYQITLNDEEKEQIKLATAICVAMLNTALPIAKYRAFVEIINDDGAMKTSKAHPQGYIDAEFTVCATSGAGIRSGLAGVGRDDLNVRVLVFEQKEGTADVVSGYHGFTKSQKYRLWYKSLNDLDLIPTIQ